MSRKKDENTSADDDEFNISDNIFSVDDQSNDDDAPSLDDLLTDDDNRYDDNDGSDIFATASHDDDDTDDEDDDDIESESQSSGSSEQEKAKKKRNALLLMGGVIVGLGGLIGGGLVLKNNMAGGNNSAPYAQSNNYQPVASAPSREPEPVASLAPPPSALTPASNATQEAIASMSEAAVDSSGSGSVTRSVSVDDSSLLEIVNAQLDLALAERFKQQDLIAESLIKAKALVDQHDERISKLEAEVAVLRAWREEEMIKERAKYAASEMARIQANGGINVDIDESVTIVDGADSSNTEVEAQKLAEEKARKDEEARKAEEAKKKAELEAKRKAEAARKAEAERKAKAKAAREKAIISKYVVVATYPSTVQPGMPAERAWITDGKTLVEVRAGSTIQGVKVTGIQGTNVVTSAGTIPAAK